MDSVLTALARLPLPLTVAGAGLLLSPTVASLCILLRQVKEGPPPESTPTWLLLAWLLGVPLGALYGAVYGCWWWLMLRLPLPAGWLLALGAGPPAVLLLKDGFPRHYSDDNHRWLTCIGNAVGLSLVVIGALLAWPRLPLPGTP